MQISGRAPELTLEQREKRTLAKRIIKAIQPALEDAIRKESELSRKPFENELKDLDSMLGKTVQLDRASPEAVQVDQVGSEVPNGIGHKLENEDEHATSPKPEAQTTAYSAMPDADHAQALEPSVEGQGTTEEAVAVNGETKDVPSTEPAVPQKRPLTPPLASQDDPSLPLAAGGIQWYLEPFDPIGTTIHEERWTGRDVMRGMSEELSELDEDEMKDLVDLDEMPPEGSADGASTDATNAKPAAKVHKTRKRWRGFK